MTRSKFNSKFRMSGIRSMIFILIFTLIICIPIGFAVKKLTPEEYLSTNADQDDIIADEDENIDSEDNDNTGDTTTEDEAADDTTTDVTDENTDTEETTKVKFDKKAKNGLMPGVDAGSFDNIDEGKFVYVVNKNISLKDSKSEANILIYNPKQNSFNLSLTITVNGEDIYKTDVLKPNQYIENDYFDIELSKGEYDGEIEVIAFDKDTNAKQEVYTDKVKITVTK